MLFSLFFTHVLSGDDYVIKKYTACPGQSTQYFAIKKFTAYHPWRSRGVAMRISIVAELSQKVQEPYVEIQIADKRIPLYRKRDPLCRPGILVCPASFSQLVYGAFIPIPSTIPYGDYKLRVIFKEGSTRISCYEADFPIQKFIEPENEDVDDEEYYVDDGGYAEFH